MFVWRRNLRLVCSFSDCGKSPSASATEVGEPRLAEAGSPVTLAEDQRGALERLAKAGSFIRCAVGV
eukprot:1192815-Prorocentrum_minimum.AAC.1